MMKLTDQQILDLFSLKMMPEVTGITVSMQGDAYSTVHVHGAVDADMMPVVKSVERIIGAELRPTPIKDREKNRETSKETVQYLKYDRAVNLNLTIISLQTFDDVA